MKDSESSLLQNLINLSGRFFLLCFPFLGVWVICLTIAIVRNYVHLRALRPGILTAAIPYLPFATVAIFFGFCVVFFVLGELVRWASHWRVTEAFRRSRTK
jgi:hypothetical protein